MSCRGALRDPSEKEGDPAGRISPRLSGFSVYDGSPDGHGNACATAAGVHGRVHAHLFPGHACDVRPGDEDGCASTPDADAILPSYVTPLRIVDLFQSNRLFCLNDFFDFL